MRVVAGELGGRRLHAPRGSVIRPTSDRVREAVFSILGPIEGAEALDLFAGTGAMAIEAISRGAARATLVDRSVGAAARNVGSLGLEERVRIVRADARTFLARDGGQYDLIFCDPPYRLARRLGPDLDNLLRPRLREGGRLIVETAADGGIDLSLPVVRERSYGGSLIRVHGSPS
jgi:16S rRNA (guanine966-N2)-methyltransferase